MVVLILQFDKLEMIMKMMLKIVMVIGHLPLLLLFMIKWYFDGKQNGEEGEVKRNCLPAQ